MITTPSNAGGSLNPEAHEFKYKSLHEKMSKDYEKSNEDKSKNAKKRKGKYDIFFINNLLTRYFAKLGIYESKS